MIRPLHNWQLKLLSLLSAVVLWFFVVGIENTVYLFPDSFQVKALNTGKSVSLAAVIPEARIYVNTRGKDPKSVSKNDFEAFVDLSGLGAGNYELPVQVSSQNSDVSVLKTDPETIDVVLAPVAEKELAIIPEVKGSPATGYSVKETKTDIKTATVTGAKNILDKIDSLSAPVVLSGTETADLDQTADLEIPSVAGLPGDSVRIDPAQALVTVVIVPSKSQKIVNVTPVIVGTGDPEEIRKELVVTPASVTVTGEEKYLQDLSEVKTEPVETGALLNRTLPLTVGLVMPQGVQLADPSLQVTLKISSGSDEQKTVFAPVVVTRESGNFKTKKVTPDQIKVTLSGPPALLDNLQSDGVTVNLNLSGQKQTGNVAVGIDEIIVPAGAGILDYQPAEVKVE